MLLYYNEISVRRQIEALTRCPPSYFGARRLTDASLPADRTLTVRETDRRIDRVLDRLLTRVGWRMERVKPLAPAGPYLTQGSVAPRPAQYPFQVHGVSARPL
jgi:hypothetical protein